MTVSVVDQTYDYPFDGEIDEADVRTSGKYRYVFLDASNNKFSWKGSVRLETDNSSAFPFGIVGTQDANQVGGPTSVTAWYALPSYDNRAYMGIGNEILTVNANSPIQRADIVFGGTGNDTLATSLGDDSVVGGSGDDLIFSDGNYHEFDGENPVQAYIVDRALDPNLGPFPSNASADDLVYGDGWDKPSTLSTDKRPKDVFNAWSVGSSDTDNDGNVVATAPGNDIIITGRGSDTIYAGDGDDYVDAGPRGVGDTDTVSLGAGTDLVVVSSSTAPAASSAFFTSYIQNIDPSATFGALTFDAETFTKDIGFENNALAKAAIGAVTDAFNSFLTEGLFLGVEFLIQLIQDAILDSVDPKTQQNEDTLFVLDFDPREDILMVPAKDTTVQFVATGNANSDEKPGILIQGTLPGSTTYSTIAVVEFSQDYLDAVGPDVDALAASVAKTLFNTDDLANMNAFRTAAGEDALGLTLQDGQSFQGIGAFAPQAIANLSASAIGGTNFGDNITANSTYDTSNTTVTFTVYDEAVTIYGFDGNDIITGGIGSDTLRGGDGDDIIFDNPSGYANNEGQISFLYGEDGDDQLITNSGLALIDGGSGTDTLEVQNGTAPNGTPANINLALERGFDLPEYSLVVPNDSLPDNASFVVSGQTWNYNIYDIENVGGSDYGDVLVGTSDANRIWGQDGNDILDGNGGSDEIFGNAGDDWIFASMDGASRYHGGNGYDNLVIDAPFKQISLVGPDGTYTIVDRATGETIGVADTIEQFVFADGTVYTAHAQRVTSLILDFDSIGIAPGPAANAYANLGITIDAVIAGDADETNVATIIDSDASSAPVNLAQAIKNWTADNVLVADATSGAGGEPSTITFTFDKAFNVAGLKLIGLSGDTSGTTFPAVITGHGAGAEQSVTINPADSPVGENRYTPVDLDFTAITSLEIQLFGPGAVDDIVLTPVAAADGSLSTGLVGGRLQVGARASETLHGSVGADVLTGSRGDDTLLGRAADDVLNGKVGDDTLRGQTGDDVLDGGGGDDVLRGGVGNDHLDGGRGSDTLIGYTGVDSAEFLTLSSGVQANLEEGVAVSRGDVDVLRGIENLIGTRFNDWLTGDGGDNILDGRDGAVHYIGGGGADIFVVRAGSKTAISDFDPDDDQIALGRGTTVTDLSLDEDRGRVIAELNDGDGMLIFRNVDTSDADTVRAISAELLNVIDVPFV